MGCRAICRSHLTTRRPYLCSTAAGPTDFREHCNKSKHHQICVLSLEAAVTCAVVWNPNSLCVFVIGFNNCGHKGCTVVRCGESEKIPQTRYVKNVVSQSLIRLEILYPKQYIAMETVPCDHPVIFDEFCLQQSACRSCEAFLYRNFFAGNVLACIYRVMRRHSNQMTYQKYINPRPY